MNDVMTKHFPTVPWLALGLPLLLALPLRAQDPGLVREIQEIARRVDEQLQEIDRLLLESGKKAQPRTGPKSLLEQTREKSRGAEASIEELIDKLTQMKNQSSGGSGGGNESDSGGSEGQQQDRPGEQQPRQGGQQPRRENQTPEFVQQPREGQQQQPQPGAQPQSQPQPARPEAATPDPGDPGQNRPNKNQPEPELGPGHPGQGEGTWGELPPYVNHLKNKGSAPTKVPEKYRKYWEAYLKQKQAGGSTGGGR